MAAVTVAAVVGTPSAGAKTSGSLQLRLRSANVAVARPAKPFVRVTRSQTLPLGNSVQTDATGSAEVRYPDGSVARLGAYTTFAVLALAKGSTRVRVETGEVWNRVKRASGSTTRYQVDTPNASASVRGTAFVVRVLADRSTVVIVREGVVDVTPRTGGTFSVTPGQQITVDPAGATAGPQPAAVDPFVEQNAALDAAEAAAMTTTTTKGKPTTTKKGTPPPGGGSSGGGTPSASGATKTTSNLAGHAIVDLTLSGAEAWRVTGDMGASSCTYDPASKYVDVRLEGRADAAGPAWGLYFQLSEQSGTWMADGKALRQHGYGVFRSTVQVQSLSPSLVATLQVEWTGGVSPNNVTMAMSGTISCLATPVDTTPPPAGLPTGLRAS